MIGQRILRETYSDDIVTQIIEENDGSIWECVFNYESGYVYRHEKLRDTDEIR